MQIEISIVSTIALLSTDLTPAIEAGTAGIAEAIEKRLAPYPPPRPRVAGKGYYIRGKGSFSASGKLIKASENLGRKWSIKGVAMGARLRNTASYAALVHGRKKQAKYHGKHGWVREDEAIAQVLQSGDDRDLMRAAIVAAFRRSAKP